MEHSEVAVTFIKVVIYLVEPRSRDDCLDFRFGQRERNCLKLPDYIICRFQAGAHWHRDVDKNHWVLITLEHVDLNQSEADGEEAQKQAKDNPT